MQALCLRTQMALDRYSSTAVDLAVARDVKMLANVRTGQSAFHRHEPWFLAMAI